MEVDEEDVDGTDKLTDEQMDVLRTSDDVKEMLANPAITQALTQLLFLESENPEKDVYMYINSPGGIVSSGLAIYDTMQYIQPKVNTLCMGQAASMGSLLLAGGAPGCRSALPNARIMIHQPSGGAQGMASDIAIQAEEIIKLRTRLNGLYASHTGKPLKVIEQAMDRDLFMDPREAQEFGIIDSIISNRKTPQSSGKQ
ncbi:hypothetical protein AM588_10008851 [Phytophthora nicotianae]|uniref:ATP-dependent Clp protease proteolytic subunit n=1 Tax=Phytophthora nicotianae TaxID=4792 RepID=A0A0W8DUI9_PHYNI|nr:hypothetical protein AM588_10008851 [Phytophthora nicotianae]